MVRGTKRKILIEKIAKKESLATCFSKRSYGLYSKASQLCLLSGAQIAVLATPSSSQSYASFYSFGHSSVDSVVSAFLAGERPVPLPEESKQMREDVGVCLARKNLGLGFWWDDESLHRSENPEEIKEAIESLKSMLSQLRSQKNHEPPKKKRKHETQPLNQILNFQSNSATCCLPNDDRRPETVPEIVVLDDEEQSQILAISDSNLPAGISDHEGCSEQELAEFATSLDELIDFETSLSDEELDAILATKEEENQTTNLLQRHCKTPDDGSEIVIIDDDDEEDDQNLAVSESFCSNESGNYLDDIEKMELDGLSDCDEAFTAQELEDFVASLTDD